MLIPSRIRSILFYIISQMNENVQNFVQSPGKDFTRSRKVSFCDVLLALLSLGNSSLSKELDHYFSSSGRPGTTSSAFVQQRSKLNEQALPFLFNAFNNSIPFLKTFKGLHLLACDGTDINLPADRHDSVNLVRYKKDSRIPGYWQMHVVVCFDLLEKRYLDAVIQPRPAFNEAAALCAMAQRCPLDGNSLYIADRGFPSFNLMAHIICCSQYFLFRTISPSGGSSFLKHAGLPASGEYDRDLSLHITRSYKTKYRKHPESFRCLHRGTAFDFIAPDDRETVFPLDLRVVCITLDNGTQEYLVTNLPRDLFPAEDLKELYRLRWGIETSFRSLKYTLSLNCLHSVKRSFIIQEIYAKMIMYNWTSLTAAYAEHRLPPVRKGSSKEYMVPFSEVAMLVHRLIFKRITNRCILEQLLAKKIPIRPGRSFPRNVRSQTVRPLNNRG